MSGPKQNPIQLRAMLVVRGLVATVVALSFVAAIAPFVSVSSGATGLMPCCIGKPGHEQGSCDSGLMMGTLSESQSKPATSSIKTVFAEAVGGHCALHEESPSDTSSVSSVSLEKSEPEKTGPTGKSEPETILAPTEEPELVTVGALSSRCSGECGTCSVSNTRLPRPREQTTLTLTTRSPLTSLLRYSPCDWQPTLALARGGLRLSPRGPPALPV